MRQSVIGLFITLSSELKQREYQTNVPFVSVSAELVCQWFDDLYHPDDDLWRSYFRPSELEAMARFHTIFERNLASLPPGGIDDWLKTDEWKHVMGAALVTLQSFDQEPDHRISKDHLGGK
jgi:hypothetical protein